MATKPHERVSRQPETMRPYYFTEFAYGFAVTAEFVRVRRPEAGPPETGTVLARAFRCSRGTIPAALG